MTWWEGEREKLIKSMVATATVAKPIIRESARCYRDPASASAPRMAAARRCRENEMGELHIGGTSVISRYLGRGRGDEGENLQLQSAFYDDKPTGRRWLVTGDQALIDDDGVVHILGRYKDLIIRGGENIAPVKIELCMSELPGLAVSLFLLLLLLYALFWRP